MYELGYAVATGKDVIIICGPTTEKFPFDIQHRGILTYAAGSPSDFKRMQDAITAKLNAFLARQEKTSTIVAASPVKSNDGLLPHELTALALLLANSNSLDDTVPALWLKDEMRRAGFREAGTRLAMARLVRLGYAESSWARDGDEPYVVYSLTKEGEEWLLENQSLLELETPKQSGSSYPALTDDDIPF